MKAIIVAASAPRPEAYDVLPRHSPDGARGTDAEYVITFGGRGCYQSWDRPNAATRRDADYVRSAAIGKGHGSILEHASVTFYITGISRSCTHELIRHRHLSYSELSQRYVDMGNADYVTPPALRDTQAPRDVIDDAVESAQVSYDALRHLSAGIGLHGKRARQAARAVMPECTETRITVTGNLRAWRHFVITRGSEHADDEIRELALELLDQLYGEAPSVFGDLSVVELADGREVVEV